jgi:TolB protein
MAFGRLEADMLTTTLWVSDAEGNRPTRLAELKHPHGFVLNNTRLDWSPDGKVILAPVLEEQPRRQIGFIDVATGRIELSKHRWSDLGGVAWLRDGSGFLVAGRPDNLPGRSSQIWRVDYPAGTLRQVTNDVREYLDVHVAEGLFVASSFEEMSTLWIASAENLPHATELETDGESWAEGAYGVAWAPDGRLIYTSLASGENDLWELEVRSGVRRQLTSEASYDGLPAVSPDGRAIAFVSNRDGPVRVWVMDRDGGRARPLTTGPFDMFPAWGHDGSYLLFLKPRTGAVAQIVTFPEGRERPLTTATDDEPVANTFRGYAVSRDGLIAGYVVDGSWRLAVASRDARAPRLLDARWGSASPLAWSPDGLAIHVVNPSDQFNLWSYPVDGGTPTRLTNFATPRIRFFAWSPDGKSLALSHGQDRMDVMVFADQSRR